mmetsp:Transcript_266/g.746  ORF Transcript_266/g.746 Transcript_266/m.746 type:complete len:414 (-) Transcript_266:1468-2709(-)
MHRGVKRQSRPANLESSVKDQGRRGDVLDNGGVEEPPEETEDGGGRNLTHIKAAARAHTSRPAVKFSGAWIPSASDRGANESGPNMMQTKPSAAGSNVSRPSPPSKAARAATAQGAVAIPASVNAAEWVGKEQNIGRSAVHHSKKKASIGRGEKNNDTILQVNAAATKVGIGLGCVTVEAAGSAVVKSTDAKASRAHSLDVSARDIEHGISSAEGVERGIGIGDIERGIELETDTFPNDPEDDPPPQGTDLARMSPRVYAIDGMGSSPSQDGYEPPADDGSEVGSNDREIQVVATLVDPTKDNYPTAGDVVVTAAQPLKCGIKFSDRRVRLSVRLVLAAFVALAVGLGVSSALGGGRKSSAGDSSAAGLGSDSLPREHNDVDGGDDGLASSPIPPTPEPPIYSSHVEEGGVQP